MGRAEVGLGIAGVKSDGNTLRISACAKLRLSNLIVLYTVKPNLVRPLLKIGEHSSF